MSVKEVLSKRILNTKIKIKKHREHLVSYHKMLKSIAAHVKP